MPWGEVGAKKGRFLRARFWKLPSLSARRRKSRQVPPGVAQAAGTHQIAVLSWYYHLEGGRRCLTHSGREDPQGLRHSTVGQVMDAKSSEESPVKGNCTRDHQVIIQVYAYGKASDRVMVTSSRCWIIDLW